MSKSIVRPACAAVLATLCIAGTAVAQVDPAVTKVDNAYMITPQMAYEWNAFKAQGGSTYAGSPGWKRYTDYLIGLARQYGLVDIDTVDIPYDHYVVDDWPDRNTHVYASGVAVEKLVTDGTPVPVVASYGMTSGSTPAAGLTAPMIWYDPANPPSAAQMDGKILVAATVPYPDPVPGLNGPYEYTASVINSYAWGDVSWEDPAASWPQRYVPVPASQTSAFHTRWVWSQLNGFASTAIAGNAKGMVVVYDLSPGAALGLIQRSVYTPTGRAGAGAVYSNVPTLTLDRVNGAKVIADAKAGKNATLTLLGRFQVDTGKAFIGYLPGKDYGTANDRQVMIATHTDAMSLVEDNGGFGMLGVLYYFAHIPQAQRPRTLIFYFDARHFMPGGEGSWPQYDYYNIHPELLPKVVATVGMEHMGGRATRETGPDGNTYEYVPGGPEDGALTTSYIDVNNNNRWFIRTFAKAATDNNWPWIQVKAGPVEPGIHGGLQGATRSPLNKGSSYTPPIPGVGLAGDWPGAWTQTYSQIDTEAGPNGFSPNYFVQQVAGMTQVIGNLMVVAPIVIDFGWGRLKSGLACPSTVLCTTAPVTGQLPDSQFTDPTSAGESRTKLLAVYDTVMDAVESGQYPLARGRLNVLKALITRSIKDPNRAALNALVDDQAAKLPGT